MSEPVNFKHKISRQRPYGKAEPGLRASEGNLGAVIDQLESDRGRIINSAAVRRLQQKTQVFPLERNAAVRSRLTHSLEVQQTGRFIVRTLYKQLGRRAAAFGLDGLETALESLVEMTCLMHDIGNPPFGHFGEYAIGSSLPCRQGRATPGYASACSMTSTTSRATLRRFVWWSRCSA
jgi:dGTPase